MFSVVRHFQSLDQFAYAIVVRHTPSTPSRFRAHRPPSRRRVQRVSVQQYSNCRNMRAREMSASIVLSELGSNLIHAPRLSRTPLPENLGGRQVHSDRHTRGWTQRRDRGDGHQPGRTPILDARRLPGGLRYLLHTAGTKYKPTLSLPTLSITIGYNYCL